MAHEVIVKLFPLLSSVDVELVAFDSRCDKIRQFPALHAQHCYDRR